MDFYFYCLHKKPGSIKEDPYHRANEVVSQAQAKEAGPLAEAIWTLGLYDYTMRGHPNRIWWMENCLKGTKFEELFQDPAAKKALTNARKVLDHKEFQYQRNKKAGVFYLP
jgi:hypothetical protein